jgi:putative hydrolase of the HAD superfamily
VLLPTIADIAAQVFNKKVLEELVLRPNAKHVLMRLKDRCYKLGLVSNTSYSPIVLGSMKKFGIFELFDTIVLSDKIGIRKPSRRMFDEALNNLNLKPSKAIFVGDRFVEDILGAERCGIRAILITEKGKQEPLRDEVYCISDIGELLEILL